MLVTKEAVTIALALQNKGDVAKFLSIEFLDQKDDCFFLIVFFQKRRKILYCLFKADLYLQLFMMLLR